MIPPVNIARFFALMCLLFVSVIHDTSHAQSNVVTVRLNNGGSIRGIVVVDIPGQPLVIESAGQSYQIPREDIAQVSATEATSAPPQPTPATLSAPVSGPSSSLPRIHLVPDSHNRYALVDPNWSPEIVGLVNERNAATRRMNTSFVLPAIIAGGGLIFVATAVFTTKKTVSRCDNSFDDSDFEDCLDFNSRLRIGMIVAGTIVHAVGVGLIVRAIVRRLRGKSARRRIDEQLLRLNVVPSAQLALNGGFEGGLVLTGEF